ncbi:MAG: hypothetical protein ABIJ15_00580 [bacterium]
MKKKFIGTGGDARGCAVGGAAYRRRSRLRLAPAILRAYCQTPRIDGSVRHHPPPYTAPLAKTRSLKIPRAAGSVSPPAALQVQQNFRI